MKKKQLAHLSFLAAALIGMVVLRVSTAKGAGIGGDATIYLTSAQNLLDGKGFGLVGPRGEFRIMPYFAPFFPLVLTLPGLLGIPLEAAAHWLNIFLFGAVIWLLGSETWRATKSLTAAWLAGLLAAASPVLVPVFSWAISEPLSIFLGFWTLALMLEYLRQADRKGLLAAAAITGGLAFFTRYAAAAYLATAAVLLLLFDEGKWGRRLVKVLLFGVAGSIPAAGWMLYNISNTTTVSSRSVLTIAAMLERVKLFWPQMEEVILFWLVPDSWIQSPPYPAMLNHVLSVGFLLVVAGWTVIAVRLMQKTARKEQDHRILMALALFSLIYTGVIAAVYFTTSPPITIGSRMLSPLMAAVFWLIVLLAVQSGRQWHHLVRLKNGLLMVVLLLGLWNAARTMRIVKQNVELGLGYNSVAWQTSDTMQAVRDLPEDVLIVTNEETAVLYLTGRASYPIAEIYVNDPQADFVMYGDGDWMDDPMEEMFRQGDAVFVQFDSLASQVAGLYGERSEAWAAALVDGLEVVYQGQDGGIYRYPDGND
ncbi:MAG: hypothetical protein RBT34_03860 [Anaerolineaceae bacterium]|jgi:hypothetical protein|nr:hypothetical protein [Anaerolineaceae bacterium]